MASLPSELRWNFVLDASRLVGVLSLLVDVNPWPAYISAAGVLLAGLVKSGSKVVWLVSEAPIRAIWFGVVWWLVFSAGWFPASVKADIWLLLATSVLVPSLVMSLFTENGYRLQVADYIRKYGELKD